MSDLISRSALLDRYDKIHVGAPGAARKLIEEAPAVDAVPVDKIHFTDLYLDGSEAIAVFKFGNQGITLRKKCEDFAPVVHGRWGTIERDKVKGEIVVECSECGAVFASTIFTFALNYNYCHNCGARMDGEEE